MIVLFTILLALLLIGAVTVLLLKRQLREKYAVLWLLIGFIVLILGVFPQLLFGLTESLGVQVPSNLLFAIAIVLLLGVALHLSWELSRAEEEIRRVAEESAILRTELEGARSSLLDLAARVRALEAGMGEPERADLPREQE